jgi:hypothetical protein
MSFVNLRAHAELGTEEQERQKIGPQISPMAQIPPI